MAGNSTFNGTGWETAPFGRALSPIAVPYRLATWGDSRANGASPSGPDISGTGVNLSPARMSWVAHFLGDAQYTRNYGVSGDVPSNWNNAARTGGKTIADLMASNVDVVVVQNAINSWNTWSGSPAFDTNVSQVSAALQAFCTEVLKGGKFLAFESTNPCSVASYSTNAAQKQQGVDACNTIIRDFLANFPGQAVFVDTTPWTKDATGFANPTYFADGLHFNQEGAFRAGQQIARELRAILPERSARYFSNDTTARPNLIEQATPTAFTTAELGTTSTISVTHGVDADGFYSEFSWTPLTLSSGECRVRIELHANVGSSGGATPVYTVAVGDVLQASARILLDNGAGGPPNVEYIFTRIRAYRDAGGGGGSVFADTGFPSAGVGGFEQSVDVRHITPTVTLPTSGGSANIESPLLGRGVAIHFSVSSAVAGGLVRLRVRNPMLRKVA